VRARGVGRLRRELSVFVHVFQRQVPEYKAGSKPCSSSRSP
jgi:hypothetical protein